MYAVTLVISMSVVHPLRIILGDYRPFLSLGLFLIVFVKYPLDIGARIMNPQTLLDFLKIGFTTITWVLLLI